MGTRNESRLFGFVGGGLLVLLGLLGFAFEAGFDRNDSGELLGIFEVNGRWNVFHIILGAIGIAAAAVDRARWYCLIAGWLLVLIGVGQLFVGDEDLFLSAVPAGTGLAVFQIVLGLLGVAAGWRSQRELRDAGELRHTERGF